MPRERKAKAPHRLLTVISAWGPDPVRSEDFRISRLCELRAAIDALRLERDPKFTRDGQTRNRKLTQ